MQMARKYFIRSFIEALLSTFPGERQIKRPPDDGMTKVGVNDLYLRAT